MLQRSPVRTILFSLALVLAPLTASTLLRADTVVLKNGDKLTGTAVKLDSGKLTFKPDYSDPVPISFDQVTSLTVTAPLVLPTPKGNLSVTALERTSAGIVVTTSTGPVTMDPGAIAILRSPADQKAYEETLHPDWAHGWAGAATVSLALARGNSNTSTFGLGVTAARPTLHDKTALYANLLYATNANSTPTTSANSDGGGIRYDHNLTPRVFAFATGDFYADALQELDLRSIIGGGAGVHVKADAKQTFDVLAGVVYTHESYSATAMATSTNNNFPALDLGEQWTRKFGANSVLTEQFNIYPDLSDTSNYQMTANAAFGTKIAKFLSWTTAFSDNYTSFPPVGTLDNDLVLTTGLGINFATKP